MLEKERRRRQTVRPKVELDPLNNGIGLAVSVLELKAIVLVAGSKPPGHSTVIPCVTVLAGSTNFDIFIMVVAADLAAISEKYLGHVRRYQKRQDIRECTSGAKFHELTFLIKALALGGWIALDFGVLGNLGGQCSP